MLTALLILAVLALAALALGLADRSLARLAERRAARHLIEPAGGGPVAVRLRSTPFLTQALRGRYRDVQVVAGGLRLGELAGVSMDARLTNVWLPPRALLGAGPREMACEHVDARLLIPYAELARASHVPGLRIAYEAGRLVATAALPVPGIGQLAQVAGQAQLDVEGNAVRLRITGLSVAGLGVTALVIGQLLPRLDVPISVPDPPWGLRILDLAPTADGLAVRAAAAAVTLR